MPNAHPMELLKRLRTTATQLTEPKAPGGRAQKHGLFFVRGHPRSGTNWVGALLNLHPQVNCFGEFHFEDIRNAIDVHQGHPWQLAARDPLKSVLDECFQDMVRRCMLTLEERKPEAYWIGDRTPRGLRIFIEHAPYILIIRDGRDVLISWTFHVLRMRQHVVDVLVPPELRQGFEPVYRKFQAEPEYFLRNPHELLAQEGWVRLVAERWAGWMRADLASIERIRANDPGSRARLLELRYEALRADVEAERQRMYDFLGLDLARAEPLSAETRTLPGFEKEDPTSFWRHGAVGDWKKYATDDFKRWFKESAGDVLAELRYEMGDQW
jgi:hypothetical protein